MADSYKLVVFGGAGVGKTSAVVQLIEKRYGALDSSWAHEDAHFVELVVDGEKAGISVYDTSTAKQHQAADRESHIKAADGYIVMYGVDVSQTFHEVWQFKDQVMSLRAEEGPIFGVVLAGNKSDLDLVREVERKDAVDLAASWGSIPSVELSSKDHASVEQAFQVAVREMRKYRKMNAAQKKQRADQCSVM